ncbi:MAG: hypothetical protein ACPGAD_01430 [Pseudomonadales bacterium]
MGSISGYTGDIGELQDLTFKSSVKNSALNGQALSLEIIKTSGEELEIDNVRGTVETFGDPNSGNDARFELFVAETNQTFSFTASGENWTFQDLVDAVNASSGSTGFAAQLSPINTTRAFVYNPDESNARELTLSASGRDSLTFSLGAGTTLEDLVDLVNADYERTGVKAIAEGNAVRFLSEADALTVEYNADPGNDSSNPLFDAADANQQPNEGFSETYRKTVNFYRTGDSDGGVTLTFTDPFGTVTSTSFSTVQLDDSDPPNNGPANNAEEALTLLDASGANFTLSVIDEFIDELGERRGYYGGVMNSLEAALNLAEATEDQALRSENNTKRIDRPEVFARSIESEFLVDASLAMLSQANARRASTLDILMFRPRGYGYGY